MRPFVKFLLSAFVVTLLLQVFPVYSGQSEWRTISKEEKAVLTGVVQRYKEAWNSGKLEKYIALFHSESRFKKAFKNDKSEFGRQFNEAIEKFGTIESSEIYEYAQDKDRYNVMFTFAKYGWDPVMFVIRGDDKNGWFIFDVEHRP